MTVVRTSATGFAADQKIETRFTCGESGVGILELLVILTVMSFVIAGVISLNQSLVTSAVGLNDLSALDTFRRQIPALIVNSDAWDQTIEKNFQMKACLRGTPGNCVLHRKYLFDLYDPVGAIAYSSALPNGITVNGTPCGPGNQVNSDPSYATYRYPSRECPLRFQLWFALMDMNTYPIVAIFVELEKALTPNGAPYLPNFVFNPFNYGYTLPPNGDNRNPALWQVRPPQSGEWPRTLIYRSATP